MGVEGVRSIGHVTITQKNDYFYDDLTSDGDENTFYYYPADRKRIVGRFNRFHLVG